MAAPHHTTTEKITYMRKIILAATALAALAVPAVASAANTTNVTCYTPPIVGYNNDNSPIYGGPYNGMSIPDQTITGNLIVPAGATCRVGWINVQGNASVSGNLNTFGQTHFYNNVDVQAGGSFAASNWGVTIDRNLTITDPAANSGNGFWGDYSPNIVKGAINYTIDSTAAAAYPQYQWPYLYFGGPTKVTGNVKYSVGSLSSVRPFQQGALTAGSYTTS
jgi:hypothetical protein